MTKTAIAVAGVLAVAGAAQGVMIMQTEDFGPANPNFSETLTFDKFDGSLGTLLSVYVKLSLSVEGGAAFADNDGVEEATIEIQFGATGSISSVDVPLLDGANQPVTGGANNQDDGGPDNAEFFPAADSDQADGFIGAAFLANYVGAGMTFDVLVEVDRIFEILGEGGVAGSFTPNTAEGNVMVVYEYIPSPGAAGLLGLAGVAATRRRRA